MQSDLVTRVGNRLAPHFPAGARLTVGLSGGLDSVVLLHVLHSLAQAEQWQLMAVHIHHGLQAVADEWVVFCTELCQAWGIPLQCIHLDLGPSRKHLGVEAAAREGRYQVFSQQACDAVLLAHHQDDQAETVLLQLFRGSGVRGMAAMPFLQPGAPALVRPLLEEPRSKLLAYAQAHQLVWIEDPSNTDQHYARNHFRHAVLPVIAERYPAYRSTLERTARHCGEAAELLEDLARLDAGSAIRGQRLQITALQHLSEARARNLLRYFIDQVGAPLPDTRRLNELLRQLRQGAHAEVQWQGWVARSYRQQLWLEPCSPIGNEWRQVWQPDSSCELPAGLGSIRSEPMLGQGLKNETGRQLIWRFRQGGEVMKTHRNGLHRSLKNLFQETGIPPWWRGRWPLLCEGDEIVWFPGIGVAPDWQVGAGECGWMPRWVGCPTGG